MKTSNEGVRVSAVFGRQTKHLQITHQQQQQQPQPQAIMLIECVHLRIDRFKENGHK